MERLVALLRSLWRNLFDRGRSERELDAELRAYVELLTDEKIRAGMSPADARRAAFLECGGVDQVKERVREAWLGDRFMIALREARVVTRSLLRSPGYLFVSVATLAVGLGGATAVFTVVEGALLRPLPAAGEPDQLVSVERLQSGRQIAEWSYADYADLRDRAATLDGLAAYNGTSMALEDASGETRAWVSYVSDDFFAVLAVQPAAGRLFGVAGAATDHDGRVAVLGYDVWQRRYGGSEEAIGARIDLDGHAYTVLGVAPEGFVGAMARYPMEVWIPLASEGRLAPPLAPFGAAGLELASRRSAWLRLVGRLAPGATVEDAERDVASVAEWMASLHATNRDRSALVFAGAGMTAAERAEMERVPRLLALAVGVLLLIACGNVGALSLVRSTARRRELAARLALGAPRGALVRQVVLEGAVLACLSGAAGVLLARALVGSATIVGTIVPIPDLHLTLDGRVLAAALGASALTALAVSLVPALRVLRVPAAAVLSVGDRSVGRTSAATKGHRAVVAVQVAATLMLLTAAAMISSSFQRVLFRHDALEPRSLAYAGFDIVRSISDVEERVAAYRELLDVARSEPAFTGAALTSSIPPFNWARGVTVFRSGEDPPPEMLAGREGELGTRASAVTVSEGFFDLMRIRIERGRAFTADDDAGSEPVVILGRRLAGALWPDDDAVGQYLSSPAMAGPDRLPLRVIGVAEDTRPVQPGSEVAAFLYVPFAQGSPAGLDLVARTRSGGSVDDATWRRIAASVTPELRVRATGDLLARLSTEFEGERTASAWVGVFGFLALLLAALGTYGVLSQSVQQRTRELALRSALGASPASLVNVVGSEGLRLLGVGLVLGLLGAAAAFRTVRSIFTTVDTPDLLGGASAALLLTVAMAAATWLPARRAARMDPAKLLRSD